MEQIFKTHRPEVVFHAAAHKHVPLMEANVGEAVRNNVFGTKCVADLADRYGVHELRADLDRQGGASVERHGRDEADRRALRSHAVARVGDAIHGGPLRQRAGLGGERGTDLPGANPSGRTDHVTDSRMTRFFMTIPEASQLVLQAATMGAGGEIFVLEMGEPVKIVDLARDLIRLSGLPEDAIEISVHRRPAGREAVRGTVL